jgi:type IV pilus assembly protein PilF
VALTNAGVCALTVGETEAAAEMFRAALVRNSTYPNALLSMMELTHRSGNSLQARAFVQRYLAAHQPTAPVLWLCVQIERELNDAAAADRCAAQLRGDFRGSAELEQLEEQTRRDGR